MAMPVKLGNHTLGEGHPVYVVAEIGINHNGDHHLALEMVVAAKNAGCQAVKFQVRTPEIIVPDDQKQQMRDGCFGRVTRLEHARRLELSDTDFCALDAQCRLLGIDWFASCWDIPSVERMSDKGMVAHKVASACATDFNLIRAMIKSKLPLVVSTGMCSADQASNAGRWGDIVCHTVSAYPCPPEELNLLAVTGVKRAGWINSEAGYSGHEAPELGNMPTLAAVAMGAKYVERHFTTDRSLAGSDQKASLEPQEMASLVGDIRQLEVMMGDGKKYIRDCELPALKKLRRVA